MKTAKKSFSSMLFEFVRRACERMDTELRNEFLQFVFNCTHDSGGFRGQSPSGDLYYTFFGMECMRALKAPSPLKKTERYLRSFESGVEQLDFVHLTSLIRCLRRLPDLDVDTKESYFCKLLRHIDRFRCPGGGFRLGNSGDRESIYADFLAYLIYENLNREVPDQEALLAGLERFKTEDSAYADALILKKGTTTVTSAAAILKHNLGGEPCMELGEWLIQQSHTSGGFLASPDAPFPDLLSTSTALTALRTIGFPLGSIREQCLDFIGDMWHEGGGFRGSIADQASDVEYTYYGLLSLGILAGQ